MEETNPVALVILDGWGIPVRDDSVFSVARTPNFDRLCEEYPTTILEASGTAVGLPPGQMGDSNVGHMNIGAGRIVYQDMLRITRLIESGEFFENRALLRAMDHVRTRSSCLHIMGLVSDGGVHSLLQHIFALLRMAKDNGVTDVSVHAFLDGRDVPSRSAEKYLASLDDELGRLGIGRIASISGRFWAMDRDERWERVERGYRMLTKGEGFRYHTWREALSEAYARGESDEFLQPSVVVSGGGPFLVEDGDAIIFANFRADRAREITKAFVDPQFPHFPREAHPDIYYCGMMRYEEGIGGAHAHLPLTLENTLGEVVSRAGLRQIHIAETEKYAHVTFFLDGKRDQPFPGEERVLLPSPRDVDTYDQKPEMMAKEVTDEAISRIDEGVYSLFVVNYANPDMVGHTGVFWAAVRAVEVVDQCLGRFVDAFHRARGTVLIIADHGNVEDLARPSDPLAPPSPHTYHSHNPVPCILAGDAYKGCSLRKGVLADVAPTILDIMGVPKPKEMDRESLIIYKG